MMQTQVDIRVTVTHDGGLTEENVAKAVALCVEDTFDEQPFEATVERLEHNGFGLIVPAD